MIRTQVQLTEEQARSLRMLASKRRVSIAELVRQSVDFFVHSSMVTDVEARRKRAIAVAGRFRSGCTDLSTEHDRHLAEAYGQ